MDRTVESKNKALVVEAFDTLFNKHDYAAAEKFGHRTTSNIVRTFPPVVRAYSISSRACRRP